MRNSLASRITDCRVAGLAFCNGYYFFESFSTTERVSCKSGQCKQMKMPKLIPVSQGIFTFSLSVRPISLRLSPLPTGRVVRQQSSCGRWQTLFVS
jgi:hypothetical protein